MLQIQIQRERIIEESEFDDAYIIESDSEETRFMEEVNLSIMIGSLPNVLKNQSSYIIPDDFNH